MVAQVPYILVQGVLFTCISYYLIGAHMLSGHAAYHLVCLDCTYVAGSQHAILSSYLQTLPTERSTSSSSYL
jgi:Zn-dependent membrane protease YugP